MRSKALALLLFLVFAVPVAAADVSGAWVVSADIGGNAISATCTFTQADNALNGTCAGDLGESKSTGKVDGQKVGFQYEIMGFVLEFAGTLDDAGKAMKGTVNVAGAGDGAFTATKK